jgi:hypothetical protein
MAILERLTTFVAKIFKTNLEIFLEALQLSPNAQGYVSGSITELLLKKTMENEHGCEVRRIREKWEGRKHPQHHGDFYIRIPQIPHWYVLESKGVKSNSEKWHKLYNYEKLRNFLLNHADKISWIDAALPLEPQIDSWIRQHLPRFEKEYAANLYDYEEVQKYLKKPPTRETEKSRTIQALSGIDRDTLNSMIDERLRYIRAKVQVLETHFVSGTSGASERTQATPRKDEFNLISIDIFLRYPSHKFLFANPKHLESSGDDANHLQQNYIMGFVFTNPEGSPTLSITEEWYEHFQDVAETLASEDAISENDMQIDHRRFRAITDEVTDDVATEASNDAL